MRVSVIVMVLLQILFYKIYELKNQGSRLYVYLNTFVLIWHMFADIGNPDHLVLYANICRVRMNLKKTGRTFTSINVYITYRNNLKNYCPHTSFQLAFNIVDGSCMKEVS